MGDTFSKNSVHAPLAEERAARIRHILSLNEADEESNAPVRLAFRNKSIQDEQLELEKEEEQRKNLEKVTSMIHSKGYATDEQVSNYFKEKNKILDSVKKPPQKEVKSAPIPSNPSLESGYSESSAEIRGVAPTSESMDHRDIMFEVVEYLEKLSPDEKLDFGLKMAREKPDFLVGLRDDLRHRVESKKNLNKTPGTKDYWNWNNTFQSLIEELGLYEDESQEKMQIYADLATLAQDFIHCATNYGKLIITEVAVPDEEKTIKPCDMGGYAGGKKYIVKNVLFKFATDQHDLYGSDEIAAKVAGRDLQGLIQYFNIGIPDLHFPLMALVDFMGYRLQAMSLLPINKNTIIYGTPDGGKTIYDENPKFNAKMKLAAQKLNLKPHKVGLTRAKGILLYSCADLEGHEGEDGRMYCVDFARCFPPVMPDSNVKNSHLFRLFRPEFVKRHNVSLCPDTFSGFVAYHSGKQHIHEVKKATEHLRELVIPSFAKELNESGDQQNANIKQLMHKCGINLFFMGEVREYVKSSFYKDLILIEMIARVARHQINQRLRQKMQELKIDLQQPYKVVVIAYMNSLFGQSEKSKTFWRVIKEDINRSFPKGLSVEEANSTYDLRGYLSSRSLLGGLFKTLHKILGLKFTPYAQKHFEENPSSFDSTEPFDDTDLEELGERIKHMNIVAAAMGWYLSQKALVKTGGISLRLFRQAIEKFEEALSSNPGDKTSLRELANVQAILGNKEVAKRYFDEAVEIDELDPTTWVKYAEFMEESEDIQTAEQYYLKSLECDPNNHVALVKYADFLLRQENKEEAEVFYELAKRHTKISRLKEEEIYENERKDPVSNTWGKQYLLPSDRAPWTTKRGTPKSKDIKIPPNWEWVDEWTVDNEKGMMDEGGWEYSYSWSSIWYADIPSNISINVRRRRWKRNREMKIHLPMNIHSNISLEELVGKMKSATNGLTIRERKWNNISYENTFAGKEAVDWMTSHLKISKRQATQLGKKLLDSRYIRPVSHNYGFSNAALLYQFTSPLENEKRYSFVKQTADINKVLKEGALEKQGAWVKNWKRRYFVLKKGSLFYYKQKEDKVPRGIINLLNGSVVPYPEKDLKEGGPTHIFGIKTGFRTWWISAKDESEKYAWMQAISSNCIQILS